MTRTPKHESEEELLYAVNQALRSEWHSERVDAVIRLLEQHKLKARIAERKLERAELLQAYRLTAHNSGFGRQLKSNLTSNANRIAELESLLTKQEG